MAKVNRDHKFIRPAVEREKIDAKIEALIDLAQKAGNQLRPAEPVKNPSPDVSDEFIRRIRSSIEDEIVPLESAPNGEIDEEEVNREITKKALIGLKSKVLRQIATEANIKLPSRPPIEELASAVARAYEWNEHEIVKLILRHEEEGSISRGHVTRIFPLIQSANIGKVRKLLSSVGGRYIRTGVAKWFVFESVESHQQKIKVFGNYKTYQASVSDVDKDFKLAASAKDLPAIIEMDDKPILTVSKASMATARSAVRAFQTVTGEFALWGMPVMSEPLDIDAPFHPSSRLILDVLHFRLNTKFVVDINLKSARFDVPNGENTSDENRSVEDRRSQLKSVEFSGDYLLGSEEACRFLAVDDRPMVEVVFDVILDIEGSAQMLTYPVRLTFEKDHVCVQTGLGIDHTENSLILHELVVQAAADSLFYGPLDFDGLSQLADDMKYQVVK